MGRYGFAKRSRTKVITVSSVTGDLYQAISRFIGPATGGIDIAGTIIG
ncbi:MAG: hypothetical protein IPI77_20030 [Saprospiraceae bacterium]|nr:hypothetical protein [Saprospiraceae bacterium]